MRNKNTRNKPQHKQVYKNFVLSYGTIVLFIITGASACMKLNRFGEAITWCDKGLAVSFTYKLFFLGVYDLFLVS